MLLLVIYPVGMESVGKSLVMRLLRVSWISIVWELSENGPIMTRLDSAIRLHLTLSCVNQ